MSRPYMFTSILNNNNNNNKNKQQLQKQPLYTTRFWQGLFAKQQLKQQAITAKLGKQLASITVKTSPVAAGDITYSLSADEGNDLQFTTLASAIEQVQSRSAMVPFAFLAGVKKEFAFQKPVLTTPDQGNVFVTINNDGQTISPIHQLPYEAITCNMNGDAVEFHIYNPMQYRYLYATPSPSNLATSALQRRKYLPNSPHVAAKNILISPINSFVPEADRETSLYSEYPTFKYAQRHKAELKAGECLFIPAFWFSSSKTSSQTANARLTFLYEPHSMQYDAVWRVIRSGLEQDNVKSVV